MVLGGVRGLLARRDHVAAHVERRVVRPRLGPSGLGGGLAVLLDCGVPRAHNFLLAVDGDAGDFARLLLHAAAVQTLVQNLALVAEVPRAWLVCLGRLRLVAGQLDLSLLVPLQKNNR